MRERAANQPGGPASEPIIYVDRARVGEGKLLQLKAGMAELVRLIERSEPRLVAYNVYFDPDGTEMTVVHVHRDSASLELHMEVAGPEFAKFVGFVELQSIDVYGNTSESLREQFRQKAELLGGATVRMHELHAGLARFGSVPDAR
jgi:quinol monooxygenase YgiN